jgi:hypothetical protein
MLNIICVVTSNIISEIKLKSKKDASQSLALKICLVPYSKLSSDVLGQLYVVTVSHPVAATWRWSCVGWMTICFFHLLAV